VTVPNLVTLSRLALVPLIVWLSYGTEAASLWLAAGLFTLAAATDWLDGYLARRLSAPSRLGTLIDPLVDKTLVLSVFFVFADRGLLPLWLALLLMFRELAVSALRHGLSAGGPVVGANWMGKTKFCIQVVVAELGYASLLLGAAGLETHRPALFRAALLMTALSYGFLVNFVRWHRKELFSRREGASP